MADPGDTAANGLAHLAPSGPEKNLGRLGDEPGRRRMIVDCAYQYEMMATKKPTNTQEDRAARAERAEGEEESGIHEVLYERVTGRSQEVVVLPEKAADHVALPLELPIEAHVRLTEMSAQIARATGCSLPVSGIARAILVAVLGAGPTVDGCRSEADVAGAVERLIRGSS